MERRGKTQDYSQVQLNGTHWCMDGVPCSWKWLASKRKETEKSGYPRSEVSGGWRVARKVMLHNFLLMRASIRSGKSLGF